MAEITHDSIVYGTAVIDYDIEYFERKTLGIVVEPEGRVWLKAPMDAAPEQLRKKVRRRAAWILRQQRYFAGFGEPTPERKYISGESHLYLGRQYMLRIMEGRAPRVVPSGNVLEIYCHDKADAERVLHDWYRERAEVKLLEYAKPIEERFLAYGVKPQDITLQAMDKRWGYCTKDGRIRLNPTIIRASKPCIEYVITHEMCHLVCRNHTREFYALLDREMPHWERYKNRLEHMLR